MAPLFPAGSEPAQERFNCRDGDFVQAQLKLLLWSRSQAAFYPHISLALHHSIPLSLQPSVPPPLSPFILPSLGPFIPHFLHTSVSPSLLRSAPPSFLPLFASIPSSIIPPVPPRPSAGRGWPAAVLSATARPRQPRGCYGDSGAALRACAAIAAASGGPGAAAARWSGSGRGP